MGRPEHPVETFRSSATVVAVDDVVLLTLKSSDFETLLKIHHVARTALESLAKRFRAAQRAAGS